MINPDPELQSMFLGLQRWRVFIFEKKDLCGKTCYIFLLVLGLLDLKELSNAL